MAVTSKMMKQFTLSTGAKIPCLGLGCGAIQEEEIEATLRTALESGYRLFDCALLYGNEKWIGDAFEKIFSEGEYSREDVFITTKLPMIANRPERVSQFLKKSLNNLKTSYVDLYLIHFPAGFQYESDDNYFPKKDGNIQLDFDYDDLVSLWKAMEEQVTVGLAKAIGVSNFSTLQLTTILTEAEFPPTNIQVEVHAYFQQAELRQFCKNNEIVVSAYAPLGSRGRREAFKPKGVPDVLNDLVVLHIAKKYNKTSAQILLRFLIEEDVIPLPKSSSTQRLTENINLFDFELTKKEIENIRALDRGEVGRSFDYLKIFPALEKHPLNPMPA